MKIKIGGVPFKVTFLDSRREISHFETEGEPLLGEIVYSRGSIRVATDMPPELIRRVLMHEILHGVIDAYKISALKDANNVHNEDAIDQLAVGLCEALESIGLKLPYS